MKCYNYFPQTLPKNMWLFYKNKKDIIKYLPIGGTRNFCMCSSKIIIMFVYSSNYTCNQRKCSSWLLSQLIQNRASDRAFIMRQTVPFIQNGPGMLLGMSGDLRRSRSLGEKGVCILQDFFFLNVA